MTQGYCGAAENETNVTWKLSSDKKTLTLAGTGAMRDWTTDKRPGWYYAKGTIETVQFGGSVTRIGDYALADITHMTSVNISTKTTAIGDYVFAESGLTSVKIPSAVTTIGAYAFKDCGMDLTISGSGDITIADTAFSGVGSSSSPKSLT